MKLTELAFTIEDDYFEIPGPRYVLKSAAMEKIAQATGLSKHLAHLTTQRHRNREIRRRLGMRSSYSHADAVKPFVVPLGEF